MRVAIAVVLALLAGAARAGTPALGADGALHLVLTPSQKPTDLLATGEEFGRVLGGLVGVPVRVTVASDYAAVVEALRNRTADLAFVHPVGYVLANREAKAVIVAKNQWHGKTTFSARFYVRKDSGLKTLEDLRGKTIAFVDPASSSGYIYPMVLLIQRGLVQNRDPKTFFREVVFSGAHDAGMRSLLNGHVDVIASFDMAREQYLKTEAERERVVWVAETPQIPEAGIAAREGLDPAMFARVRAALLKIQGPQYAALLKPSTISTASSPPRTASTRRCEPPSICSTTDRAERVNSPSSAAPTRPGARASREIADDRGHQPARGAAAVQRDPGWCRPGGTVGRIPGDSRPQRRRQDDPAARAEPPGRTHRRHGACRRPARHRCGRRRAS